MRLELRNSVGLLTLANPPVNAVGLDQVVEITELVRSLEADVPLLVTGEGTAFCAGVDIKAFARYDGGARADLVYAITGMVAALLEVGAPVVAALNGHALGGGFVLMLCADHRIAIDDAGIRLGLTEAEAGIPFPIGPLEIIRSELTPGLLRDLTLSSRTMNPREAAAANVIDSLANREDLLDQALAKAEQLRAQPGFGAVKQQIRHDLARRVRELADSRQDPLAESFI